MRNCRWLMWGMLVIGVCMGQTAPNKTSDGLKDLEAHWATLNGVQTLEARFVCEKSLAALDTPLHSEGRVWIAKSNGAGAGGVRFSTEKPYVSELILTGGKVFGRSQHETEWTKTNQSARPGLTAVMGQLGGWSTGDSTKIAEMYAVTQSAEAIPQAPGTASGSKAAAADVFVLTPTNADLAKSLKSVTLALDHGTNLLRYIQITTQQDDATRYWFLDVKTNLKLPADVFSAGTQLIEPSEGK